MSVAGSFASAAVTALQALNLSYGSPAVSFSVKRRKVPTLPQGTNPPVILVVIKEEGDIEDLTAFTNIVKYPLAVVVVTSTGTTLADDEAIRLIREQVRQTIADKERTTFASVTQRNKVTVGGKAPFDVAALPKDLNYSVLVFTVESKEAKAT